jgi:hypothetical protein
MRCSLSIFSLLLIASLTGCSPYLEDFDYRPRPAVTEIRSTAATQPQAAPSLVALASVIGVHVADKKIDIPETIEIRLRLENNGPEAAVFDPNSMELVGARLRPFAPPITHTPGTITLNPMEAATLTAFFPLPPDPEPGELGSLTLRWNIQIGSQRLGQNVTFQRVYPRYYYYDPYWRPYGYGPGFWYGGVVVIHRR